MSFAGTTDRTRPAGLAPASPAGHATLVVGLGNPILADDGVGWRVVEALEARLDRDSAAWRAAGPVEFDRLAVGGLTLMERLIGYERVILVDAILDRDPVGTVSARPLADVATRSAGHLDCAHDVPLTEALAAGQALGAPLPSTIDVVGVAVERVDVFDERLSVPVAAAVDEAVEAVLAILRRRPDGDA